MTDNLLSTETLFSTALPNGMVLVGEPKPSFESAAFTLLTPAGCRFDPAGRNGLASLTCEMMLRGAGERDSRALVNDLDNLGVDRGESVGVSHSVMSGCGVAENLAATLAIYADIVRSPHLPEEQLESGRQVCLQELRGIEDEPSHKLMMELRRQHYPSPWGLPSQGNRGGLEAATMSEVENFHHTSYKPEGSILAVAGAFEWEELVKTVEELFGGWKARLQAPAPTPPKVEPTTHIDYDSNQCHIGVAYPSVPYSHADYFQAWAAVGILSGGMSSRLFTEVREKRGLCYTVSASLHTQLDRAGVFCYAGTTAERAQETLDVLMAELKKLREGVKQSELDRLKARIKSSLIMQQESTNSRSGSLARDWRHLGRLRSIDELSAIVDGISADSINGFLSSQPELPFNIVTLGPKPLEAPHGVL